MSFSLTFACLAFSASASVASVCDQAAIAAARNSSVPKNILMAITRAETGRAQKGRLTPWPWSVNVSGKSYFFDSGEDALDFAQKQLDAGNRNFDVGCFQINLRWHSAHFASLESAFDPQTNAEYAAQFLSGLYNSEGSWAKAVAAYHSRTPKYAEAYLARFQKVFAALELPQPPTQNDRGDDFYQKEQSVAARVNTYPLMQVGLSGTNGSLVPPTEVRPIFQEQTSW